MINTMIPGVTAGRLTMTLLTDGQPPLVVTLRDDEVGLTGSEAK